MSEENLELVRRLHEALNRRQVDTALACLHPGVELRPALPGPDMPSQFLGREGAKEFFEAVLDAWDTITVVIKETIEAPENQVTAIERWHGVGRDGIELDADLIDVYAFRDGLIARVDGFGNRAEALEAAGLSE